MKHPLPEVEVLKQCPASWRKMKGDQKVRFCDICRKNVYNLSNMTAEEAFQVMEENEGRFCSRFYQRPDGSVITAGCPPKDRLAAAGRGAAAAVLTALGLALVFPVFGATQGVSVGSVRRSYLRKLSKIDHQLAATTDERERESLRETRAEVAGKLARLDPNRQKS